MVEFICFSCDYLWYDLDRDTCPCCGSSEILNCGDGECPPMAPDFNWDDAGHYEGDFTNHSMILDETGE